jgi:hypothetical protein
MELVDGIVGAWAGSFVALIWMLAASDKPKQP